MQVDRREAREVLKFERNVSIQLLALHFLHIATLPCTSLFSIALPTKISVLTYVLSPQGTPQLAQRLQRRRDILQALDDANENEQGLQWLVEEANRALMKALGLWEGAKGTPGEQPLAAKSDALLAKAVRLRHRHTRAQALVSRIGRLLKCSAAAIRDHQYLWLQHHKRAEGGEGGEEEKEEEEGEGEEEEDEDDQRKGYSDEPAIGKGAGGEEGGIDRPIRGTGAVLGKSCNFIGIPKFLPSGFRYGPRKHAGSACAAQQMSSSIR